MVRQVKGSNSHARLAWTPTTRIYMLDSFVQAAFSFLLPGIDADTCTYGGPSTSTIRTVIATSMTAHGTTAFKAVWRSAPHTSGIEQYGQRQFLCGHDTTKPIVRPPFPQLVRDGSPIVMSSVSTNVFSNSMGHERRTGCIRNPKDVVG
ncbi:hypothetical protein GQ43DRAFT_69064 [Delitschia confertaspora ATCC 74209]|uniref:Uncharacterized protein n=1 Tax=Delitschia confertaspora ATCC 74209 TaxID=1513339 RepID=A0A9P4JJE1_9PLEO|nr:hypothetical protein GQ43DRAFT_69064 [Delitschia confertaspora ATCC 74209]